MPSRPRESFISVRDEDEFKVVKMQTWKDVSDGAVVAICYDAYTCKRIVALLNKHGEHEEET